MTEQGKMLARYHELATQRQTLRDAIEALAARSCSHTSREGAAKTPAEASVFSGYIKQNQLAISTTWHEVYRIENEMESIAKK